MIWRSIVGKLWLTIIGLVAVVLVVLSIFLSEQIISTYYNAELKNMEQLANLVRDTLKQPENGDRADYLRSVLKVAELNETYTIVLGPDGSVEPLGTSPNVPDIPWQDILEQTEVDQVLQGKPQSLRTRVIVGEEGETPYPLFKDEVMMVALPLKKNGEVTGAVVMYRTQGQLSEDQVKKLIFISAVIGIVLATIFAFFLSTRITQPLIQMKRAAERMAEGEFSARVRVRSHERDEMSDLAVAFNRMAAQLEESVYALSQEKETLASILRSMADGVITMNAQGQIIVTNPLADQLLKEWHEEGGESELPPQLNQYFCQVLEEEKEVFDDITVHGRIWALVITPLYAKNQVRGAVAVLRDVTEERRMDKLRKDFVANVSHELRTPLSMLQGYSEALVDGVASSPEDQKEIAQVIHDESLRMGRLVRELLDLARMESGHIRLEPSKVDIPDLVLRVGRKFNTIAKEQGIRLNVEVPNQLPVAWWDEDKVEQVLTNLTDNAIRHTQEGGEVKLTVVDEENEIQLTVEDTGSGIPEEDLPFIFERFYKADKAPNQGAKRNRVGLGNCETYCGSTWWIC